MRLLKASYLVFKELEAQIKADAIANSKDWFNKSKMSAEVVDALWSPMLKYPKNQATGEARYYHELQLLE